MIVPDSQADLIRRLCEGSRTLAELLDVHLSSQGELLPHVYFGDVTRHFVRLMNSGTSADRVEASQIIRQLEASMSSDEHARELVVASFLENLLGSAGLEEIRAVLPPALRHAFEAVEGGA